jgi:hypothetical protein
MRRFFGTYSPYILLTAAIMLPLLLPGYILSLDLVFTPHLRAPATLSNDWLWQNFLHYLNTLISSQCIEKTILVSIPLLAGIGMHRLITYLKPAPARNLSWYWATYVAGLFYAANPFTYSRFMAGQYAVLLGYALLPFFVRLLLRFLDKPSRGSMLRTVLVVLLISIISIHTLGEIAVVSIFLVALALWARRSEAGQKRQYLMLGLTGIGIFVLASSYWIIPLLLGQGSTAEKIQQFGANDVLSFATAGTSKIVQLSNVLKLQGFWADEHHLYLMPQDQLIGWGTLRLILWILVGWGAVTAWRSKRGLTAALLAICAVATVAAIGFPQSLLTSFGYREPQKFVGLLAFGFAIFLAFGSARLLYIAKQHSEAVYTLTASGLILVVIVFTPTMYWGFGGQIKPHEYPPDWYRANDWLNKNASNSQSLFLPWHQYMSFRFTNRIIGSPATRFFDKSVVVSNDPELGQLGQPRNDQRKLTLANIISKPDETISKQLAAQHIKYVLLAKDDDYKKYRYLNNRPGLTMVWDSPTISIYRNLDTGGIN